VYSYLISEQELTEFLKDIGALGKGYHIAFDTETSGTDARIDKLRLAQFCINDSIYILNMETIPMKYLTYVLELLIDKDTIFIMQNAKFDIKFILHNTGIQIKKVYDTMVAESVITGVKKIYAGLDYLYKKYIDIEINKDIGKKFLDSPIDNEMILYSALDVKHLFEVMEKQTAISAELKLMDTLNLEMRIVSPTAKMEWDGIYLDSTKWIELDKLSKKKIKETGDTIKDYIWKNATNVRFKNAYELALKFEIRITTKKLRNALEQITDINYIKEWWYDNFNINSRLQMMKALAYLGVDLPNFQKETLKAFKDKHTIVKHILTNKTWAKKKSTYGIDYLKYIHPVTGRIHSELNQNGAETGRYASSKPNLQQVPIDFIDGKCLWRNCFLPEEGNSFLASDYSQQEYRTVGQVTGEEKIINAYLNDLDLHANTAGIIYDIPIEEVIEEQRHVGKTINFGLLYGLTKWGLARRLNIKISEADELMSKVLSGLPKFYEFKKAVEELVLKNMYSRTLLGRIRFFDKKEIFEDHIEYEKYIARLKREGFNHIIQGTSADMLKLAFAYVSERNPFGELFKVVLLIHDEILAEIDNSILEPAKEFLEQCMSEAFYYFVPDIPTKINARILEAWSK
jgi:DNA polymerase-1